MAKKVKDPGHVKCGKRFRQFREAKGYWSLRAFAEATGTDEDNLGNWERGVSLIPYDYVNRVKQLFGVTHEWVFGGDASTIDPEISIKMLSPDPKASPRPKRRGRPPKPLTE